jgi:MFS family permease
MIMFGGSPKELTRALSVYGAAAPAGGTVGVFLGGVITQYASWPWVFYINIPIAAGALALIPSVLPRVPGRTGRQDVPGAATVTVGLAAVVFAIVRAPEVGWTAMVRLRIFAAPNLAAANAVQFLLGAAWIPMWFFLNLYLQQVLGFGSFASGSALLPMTALIMVGMVVVAPKLIARYGPKAMVVTGLATLATGMLTLSLIRANGSFWVDVLPASLIAAAGMSVAFIPSLGIALSSAQPEEAGLAAGIVNTSYQVGSALGLAVMTAVATSRGADRLTNVGSLTHGFSTAFIGAAAVAAAGAVVAGRWLRLPRPATHRSRRYRRRDRSPGANTLGRTQQPLTDKEPAVTAELLTPPDVVTAVRITPN